MGLMPSYLGGLEAVGVKVIAAFPANFGSEYDTHQGVVLFFDTERGLLRAIVDATSITAIRTAAVSGLVTDLLAQAGRRRPRDHRRRHAGAHAPAGDAGRPARPPGARVQRAGRERGRVRGARVAPHGPAGRGGRDRRGGRRRRGPDLHDDDGHGAGRARRLGRAGRAHQRRRRVHADHARARLRARRRRRASTPTARVAAQRGRRVPHPQGRGAASATTTSSARSARCSRARPRRAPRPDEITLFKSLGIAIEDLASAHRIYEICKERELGTWVEIGGLHFGKAVEG